MELSGAYKRNEQMKTNNDYKSKTSKSKGRCKRPTTVIGYIFWAYIWK